MISKIQQPSVEILDEELSLRIFMDRIAPDFHVATANNHHDRAPIMTLLVGQHAVGKSTVAKGIIDRSLASGERVTNIDNDLLRLYHPVIAHIPRGSEQPFCVSTSLREDAIRWQRLLIEAALNARQDTIIHDTAVNPQFTIGLIERFFERGFDVDVIAFSVPYDVSAIRALQRANKQQQALGFAKTPDFERMLLAHNGTYVFAQTLASGHELGAALNRVQILDQDHQTLLSAVSTDAHGIDLRDFDTVFQVRRTQVDTATFDAAELVS